MKDKINVVHMVPLGTGGITTMVLNIAQELQGSEFSINYLTFFDRVEYNEARALAIGGKKIVVPTDHYSNQIVRAVYKFFKTISVLKKEKADIVHINACLPYDIMVGVSAKLAGAKVIFHSHTSSMKKERNLRGLVMPFFRFLIPFVSDCNYTCSEVAAEYMFPKSILKKKQYSLFRNSISSAKYGFNADVRKKVRQKLNLENQFVVGHVGRMTRAKNHEFLLAIFEQILKMHPDSKLLLVGVGEKMDEIKLLTEQMGLTDHVIFYGATQNVSELLQAMDCFVMPSLFEGLPFSAIEAQASGLPSFFSTTVSSEAAVTDNVEYLSLETDPEIWAEHILKGSMTEKDRSVYMNQIRKNGYELSENVNQLCIQYRELLNR